MVIKLSEADFSAKNIGQVDITVVSEFTQDAILASGNTTMTEQQKSALEKFFIAVGAKNNSGVWAKLNKVYIPFLAGDLAHAMINYKGNANDSTLDATKYVMRNKGVTGLLASTEPNTATNTIPILINGKDFSWFTMLTENYTTKVSAMNCLSYNGNSNSNRFIMACTYSGAGDLQVLNSYVSPSEAGTAGLTGISLTSADSKGKLLGISINNTEYTSIQKDGTFRVTTNSGISSIGIDTANVNAYLFASATLQPIQSDSMAVGMFIIGNQHLTQAEMTTLKTASERLALKF